MNRYKKANEGIHAPEELKDSVAHRTAKPRQQYSRWVSAAAAVLDRKSVV